MLDTPLPPPPSPSPEPTGLWDAVSLAFELGYLIALPAVCLGFGGALIDKKYGTLPYCTIGGLALAIVLSCVAVYRKLKTIHF